MLIQHRLREAQELEIQKAAKGNWTGEIPNYFKFKLEALTPGAPEPASKEAINTGSKVTFEKITGYKEVKDYIYKISENGESTESIRNGLFQVTCFTQR
ncbi:MAG: Spy0128 family protein [Ruminococcus sp.]